MKKAYIKPETEAFLMEAANVVCTSPTMDYSNSTTVPPGTRPLSEEIDFQEIDLSFVE